MATPSETLLMYLNSERVLVAEAILLKGYWTHEKQRFNQLCEWIDLLTGGGHSFKCPVCGGHYFGAVDINAEPVVYECHGSGSTLFIETGIKWRACPGEWRGTWEEMNKATTAAPVGRQVLANE